MKFFWVLIYWDIKNRKKKSVKMQGFRNYAIEAAQQREQQIVVDLLPPQYTKHNTPPPSPSGN